MMDTKRTTAAALGLTLSMVAGAAFAAGYGAQPYGWGYGPQTGHGPGMYGQPYGFPPMPPRPPMAPYGYPGKMQAPYRGPYQAPPAMAPTLGAQPQAGSAGQAMESASVAITQMRFAAPTVTIKAGGTVTWTNQDGMPHTVTANDGSFGSERLGQGGVFSQTFDDPGSYGYYCTLHPSMRGTVVVVE
jgi:amicyanin